ncbi:MAG: cytochrome c oxidase assembly protein [Alphaproteobacteria bacterium]|nr:cytochrome c oxidase assembly protein [Alphaproteobacteria bacterium]TAD87257.1 MAG: cytochrome c oxidase assembly protein [Alphaproteobacteria bacterium]
MSEVRNRNRRTMLACLGLVGTMIGVSFAAVPLYDLFCRVTGFGGTTQVATALPAAPVERRITVRFDASLADGLPWQFRPETRSVTLAVGENGLVNYLASNRGAEAIVGTATYNVTPHKAAIYFNKLACFCFTEQPLAPGESVTMPVSFFVDPEIVNDPNLADVHTITLSYTFFRAKTPTASAAGSRQPPG